MVCTSFEGGGCELVPFDTICHCQQTHGVFARRLRDGPRSFIAQHLRPFTDCRSDTLQALASGIVSKAMGPEARKCEGRARCGELDTARAPTVGMESRAELGRSKPARHTSVATLSPRTVNTRENSQRWPERPMRKGAKDKAVVPARRVYNQ